jgi:hypothetical protein
MSRPTPPVSSRPSAGIPPRRERRLAGVAAAGLLAAGLAVGGAGPASANLVGGADSPTGNAADPAPERDLTGAGLAYDRRRGALVGVIGFRADPTRETAGFVTLFAGTRTATGCDGYPAVGFASSTAAFDARWSLLTAAGASVTTHPATKRGGQTTLQRFQVVDARLKGQRPDCAVATLTDPADSSVVWETTGPIALKAIPVLAAGLRGVPKTLTAGSSRRVRVVLRNEGDAATRAGRVRVTGARGLRVTPRAPRVKSIRAGGSRTVTLRVSLTSRARPTTALRVTATAGDQRARAEGKIALRRPARSGGGGGGGGADTGGARTCTRYVPDLFGDSGGSLALVPC